MKRYIFIFTFLFTITGQGQWSFVGGSEGFAPEGAIVPVLRFHPQTEEPYVFFFDFEQNQGAGPTLMRYDGSNWVDVGGRRFDNDPVHLTPYEFGFDFDPTNNWPIVYYSSPPAHVQTFDGLDWIEYVGDDAIQIQDFFIGSEDVGFAVNPLNGNPTIAFSDTSNGGTLGLVSCVSYGPTNWGYLDTPKWSEAVSTYFDMVYDENTAVPYLLHSGGSGNRLIVSYFNGSDWLNLPDPNFTNQSNFVAKVRIDQATGDVYAANPAFRDGLNTIEVKKWDGTSWTELVTDVTQVHAQATAFDFDINPGDGAVYLLYMDRNNTPSNPNLTVSRYDGSNWVMLGSESISGGSDHISLAFHPSTFVPYVAYGAANESGGWVKRFDGILSNNNLPPSSTNFYLSPNPALNGSRIVGENIRGFEVYNLQGQLITRGENEYIDTSSLATGIYLVRAFDDLGASSTKKLMVK